MENFKNWCPVQSMGVGNNLKVLNESTRQRPL